MLFPPYKEFILKFPSGYTIPLNKKTCIMGILNITPDSFSDGGDFFSIDSAVKQAVSLQEEGADILDIGGESSRPGSKQISVEEELSRIVPILKELISIIKIPISVDTYKSRVAERAIELGAGLINDISAMRMDPDMPKIAAETNVPIILMHMLGKPQTMQNNPHYNSLIDEIKLFFKERIDCAKSAGIKPENIIIDPGIGFGKTLEHNLKIIKYLDSFHSLGFPVLIGTSRKSMIGNILNLPPKERLEGTSATVTASILNGANIIRVHDVKEMKLVALMADAIKNV
ncbi:dihydropteroate synthase [Candidatus Desantisbacteria bacterium]|nr:dihydropteroate synthase [Candidatus Desantisbacteria bacterium]